LRREKESFDRAVAHGTRELDVRPVPGLVGLPDETEAPALVLIHPATKGDPPSASAPVLQVPLVHDYVHGAAGTVLGGGGEGEAAAGDQEVGLPLRGPVRLRHSHPVSRSACRGEHALELGASFRIQRGERGVGHPRRLGKIRATQGREAALQLLPGLTGKPDGPRAHAIGAERAAGRPVW
jgi:hypothetical protein